MKTTLKRFEQARRLTYTLANMKNPITHERTKRYYFVLGVFNKERDNLNSELEKERVQRLKTQISTTSIADIMEEKRAIKEANVTSLTYERSQRILNKQIDNRFKNR